MEKRSNWRKWITLALCGLAGSLIYKLPYLRETYYSAMQEATGASNSQLGLLMSVYGIVNFVLYLPSGWAADKFSARKLMTFSLVITGITGFYYASFPSFIMIVLLHALWAVTTVFTFWSVCVRIVRHLGESKEQGRLYGFWYLGKGITSMVVGFISVPLFSHFGEGVNGLRAAIIFFSILTIVVGLLCWFFIPDDKLEGEKSSFHFADMKVVITKPAMWLAGFIAFCMWNIYIGFGMVTPYLTEVFGMNQSQVALASVVRAYILFAIGGFVGGKLADKFKSRAKFMSFAFVGMIIFTVVYIALPGQTGMLMLALINMVALGVFIYCANAVFFSLIEEANIPRKVSGTAAGLMSMITYSSEIYCYTMVGDMVDKNPGIVGYRNVFIFMLICAVAGLIAGLVLQKINNNRKQNTVEVEA